MQKATEHHCYVLEALAQIRAIWPWALFSDHKSHDCALSNLSLSHHVSVAGVNWQLLLKVSAQAITVYVL